MQESTEATSAAEKPPYVAGQDAYRAGAPIDATPRKEEILYADRYPGPRECWRHGWLHAKARCEHVHRPNGTAS
ncbi:MAG: hypothetical protein RI571_10665 [Roseovarius sp.]|jgi:hypothetical protein|nr:hypothetical protein [Roseovarius sp.]